ncbi:DNA methyltransferase [Chromobacterium piscinae]|uniref:site-specific DNA-methyltransferase n=1 Tax=Chromobacterium piscinae TaxID=686831 RepID=UPI001E3363E9|nr:site-specific DNA-methyltransferase [Chromobacterium piscinae]MCD5327976.1 site-specific DNA-methyltransferase [Chromobacterium piscinae]
MNQVDLFSLVAKAYSDIPDAQLDNESLYQCVVSEAGLSPAALETKVAIGRDQAKHSLLKRKIRWHQQTLKHLGIIERVDGQRGIWKLSESAGKKLHRAADGVKLVAFSTNLGVAIWGSCFDVFTGLNEPITLCVTSPPYPLQQPRAYGNPSEAEYVDFVCRALEPIVKQLAPGGSVCLNVSNDIFIKGTPARSLYRERLVLALCDRLGLVKMDELIWHNPSKPPGPVQWASIQRMQLNVSWEPIYWFTNDPLRIRSDNRRVLEKHTARQLQLIAQGGEQREDEFCDGAYRIRRGSFGNATAGKIPKNVLTRGHQCRDSALYREHAERLDLPVHGAAQPLSIPEFLIRFLSEPGDLIVDPFGGTVKTGMAAEQLSRRWIVVEWMLQYIRGAAERFRIYPGFELHPAMLGV